MERRTHDIVIIGAGAIGLSLAWRLAASGADVAVLDRGRAGAGATAAAAGMLAAGLESAGHQGPGADALLGFALDASRAWPAFAAELEAASGVWLDYRTEGALRVALTDADAAGIGADAAALAGAGIAAERLDAAALLRLEPAIAPEARGALSVPADHQVDPLRLTRALIRALVGAGASLSEDTAVHGVRLERGRVAGVVTSAGDILCKSVIVAAGMGSAALPGLPANAVPPMLPVKGEIAVLGMARDRPLVRRLVWGPGIYMVPKSDGRLLLGATVRPGASDTMVTAGGIADLVTAARRLVPASGELPLVDAWAGVRPGTADGLPILGPGPVDGLLYATGHYRNGILLAPLTARLLSDYVAQGRTDAAIERFGIDRFVRSAA